MPKATRNARHYVGKTSEINVGKNNYYGIHEKDYGVGSENMSGALKRLPKEEQKERAKRAKEIEEAEAIRRALRRKKKERGKKRTEQRIASVNSRYERGEITAEQRDSKISEIRAKHREAELRNKTD